MLNGRMTNHQNNPGVPSLAVSFLRVILPSGNMEVPGIVFAVGENRLIAHALAAQSYHFSWLRLIDAVERIFQLGMATG